jgi:hypothetical protein
MSALSDLRNALFIPVGDDSDSGDAGGEKLVIAAVGDDWNEKEHPRDTGGKFTEKGLGVTGGLKLKPLHVNTAVIYKHKYADQTVVAVKQEDKSVPQRLIWDASKKKFVQQAQLPTGTWVTGAEYGKGEAYKKFSKETGWFEPGNSKPATVTAPAAKTTPSATPAAAPVAKSDVAQVSAGQQPTKINTNVIYKQKYANGAVVAEKISPADPTTKHRLLWDEKQKKFVEQINNGPNWQTIGTYGKDAAYQKFSKQTGWLTPGTKQVDAPATALVSVPAPAPVPTALKSPAVTLATIPVNAPHGYKHHVDATTKVGFVGDIGQPKIGVKSFKKTTDAKMREIQAKSKSSWTSAQENAAEVYTQPGYSSSGGYQAMNAVLRGDEGRMKLFNDSQLERAVENSQLLQEAMSPLAESVRLYRGTGAQAFGFPDTKVLTADLKKLEGHIIQDRGFVSTSVINHPPSIQWDYAKKPIKVIVRAPEGTPAVYLTSVLPYQGQNELVLGAGTSFHISEVRVATGADKASYGDFVDQVVVLDVVPTASKLEPKSLAGTTPSAPVMNTPSAPSAPSSLVTATQTDVSSAIAGFTVGTPAAELSAFYAKLTQSQYDALTSEEKNRLSYLAGVESAHGNPTPLAKLDALKLGATAAPSASADLSAKIASLPKGWPTSDLNDFYAGVTQDQFNSLTAVEKLKLEEIATTENAYSNPLPLAKLDALHAKAVTPSSVSTPLKSQGQPAGVPLKLNTNVIYKLKYQHATVVAVKPLPGGFVFDAQRLVWNQDTKKFVLQNRDAANGNWLNAGFSYTKKDAYATFSQETGWQTPEPGASAFGTGTFGSGPVPKVSGTPTPVSVAPTAPAAVKVSKFNTAELQKLHGNIPASWTSGDQNNFLAKFKSNGVKPSSLPEDIFRALHETINTGYTGDNGAPLNLLQALKIIDNASEFMGETKQHSFYEKKIVDWLLTVSGANTATKIVNKEPKDVVAAKLAEVKSAASVGKPKTNVTSFKQVNNVQAIATQHALVPWTAAQRDSLKAYTTYYDYINGLLRDTKGVYSLGDTEKLKYAQHAVNMQAAMRPWPESITVVRGTNANQFPGLNLHDVNKVKDFEGKTITDKGFFSASVTTPFSGNVQISLEVPEGTPAAYVEEITNVFGEHELILAAGLKYKVLSVDVKYGTAYVIMRVVP